MSTEMSTVKNGDTVGIHYTGTLADGTVFDSSDGRDPLEFKVGSGMVIVGLDEAIPGMAAGDKKTVEIPFAKAYGPHIPEACQAVPRKDIPDSLPIDIGTKLQMQSPQGQPMTVTVTQVTDTEVTLDANHHLAGKDLTFAFEVINISAG